MAWRSHDGEVSARVRRPADHIGLKPAQNLHFTVDDADFSQYNEFACNSINTEG